MWKSQRKSSFQTRKLYKRYAFLTNTGHPILFTLVLYVSYQFKDFLFFFSCRFDYLRYMFNIQCSCVKNFCNLRTAIILPFLKKLLLFMINLMAFIYNDQCDCLVKTFFSLWILSQWWKMSLVMLFKNRVSKTLFSPMLLFILTLQKKKKNNQ